jgi:hypothetical protein
MLVRDVVSEKTNIIDKNADDVNKKNRFIVNNIQFILM